jgi:hypothetical protein|tara:strand:- start:315 stop:506 length:192 start_codon:yes stop_codon:yes gene_type:complete
VPLLFGIIGDFMKDNEQTEIKKGFDIPYPEFDAPSVTIGGDAIKLPETTKKPVENWDSSYNDD